MTTDEAGGAAEVTEVEEEVPFCMMAFWVNMSWVLSAVGLTEKTIPSPQWPLCWQ